VNLAGVFSDHGDWEVAQVIEMMGRKGKISISRPCKKERELPKEERARLAKSGKRKKRPSKLYRGNPP
jgi:hypothetical protein